jgi:predicted lysophospholipase L1 biosynthesis ABC-type transport system permease subunit
VLGRRTEAELNVRVGQDVRTVIGNRVRIMEVVGEAVFPSFGEGSFAPTNLGDGAAVTASVVATPAAIGTDRGYNFLLLRLRSERSPEAAAQRLTQVAVAHGCPVGSCAGVANLRPANIANYARVRSIPLLLGSLLALLSVGTIAHVLVTSIRMRRREFAILKTIGFVRRQVSATIAWQATSLTAVALVIGLPLGIIVGRAAWGVFAHATGVSDDAAIPWPAITLVIPIALIVANVVALGPGRTASQKPPAVSLRDE